MGGNQSSTGERPRFPSFRNLTTAYDFRGGNPPTTTATVESFYDDFFSTLDSNLRSPFSTRRAATASRSRPSPHPDPPRSPTSPVSAHPPKRRSTTEAQPLPFVLPSRGGGSLSSFSSSSTPLLSSLPFSSSPPPPASRPFAPASSPPSSTPSTAMDHASSGGAASPGETASPLKPRPRATEGIKTEEDANATPHVTEETSKRQLAESYKTKGNVAFKNGDFEDALQCYSTAITLDPTQTVYFTNRAFCYKRLNQWQGVAQDTREALSLDDESVKAHYLLGQALVQLGDSEEGLKKLIKAKTLSSSGNYPFGDEIERTILETKALIWEREQAAQSAMYDEAFNFFTKHGTYLQHSRGNDMTEYFEHLSHFHALVEERKNNTKPFEIPSFLCCKISMSLMKDPVITQSGVTYERAFIVEHLLKNGEFDPISRKRCKITDLIPNYAIKEATQYFLERHPWAVKEFV